MPGSIIGAVASTVVGGLFGDDDGAEDANAAAADANALQAQIARDQWKRYKEIYEPLERGLVDDAQKAASPEEYTRAASDASATVSSQYAKARERLTRTPGLDPSSGAYQAGVLGLDLAQAATDATQQNVARMGVKDAAYKKKITALGLGKGLDSTAASGLANSASSSMNMAQNAQAQANAQAGAVGRVVDRVVSSPTTSNWLGNVGTAVKYNTNVGSAQTAMLQEQERGM